MDPERLRHSSGGTRVRTGHEGVSRPHVPRPRDKGKHRHHFPPPPRRAASAAKDAAPVSHVPPTPRPRHMPGMDQSRLAEGPLSTCPARTNHDWQRRGLVIGQLEEGRLLANPRSQEAGCG